MSSSRQLFERLPGLVHSLELGRYLTIFILTGATISLFTLEVTPEPPGSIMRSIAMRPEYTMPSRVFCHLPAPLRHLQRQQAEYQRRRVSLSSSLPPSTVTTIEDNAEAAAG